MKTLCLLLLAAVLLAPTTTPAAPTPRQRCEDAKLRASGKYLACRLAADATFATRGDASKRDAAYVKCAQKLSDAYAKAETRNPGACPTSEDRGDVEAYLEASAVKARDWTGGTLAAPLVFERLSASGQTACWLAGSALTQPAEASCTGTSQDAENASGAALAFVDNGDGTITDRNTGLTWEKKADDGGLHDKDDTYPWASTCSGDGATWCTRDADCAIAGGTCAGTTAFEFVDQLNASAFAGHDDWRLPSAREVVTAVDYGRLLPAVPPAFNVSCGLYGAGNPGCTLATCSCTNTAELYWTSSTLAIELGAGTRNAWQMYFGYGYHRYDVKTALASVRAVRGGS